MLEGLEQLVTIVLVGAFFLIVAALGVALLVFMLPIFLGLASIVGGLSLAEAGYPALGFLVALAGVAAGFVLFGILEGG